MGDCIREYVVMRRIGHRQYRQDRQCRKLDDDTVRELRERNCKMVAQQSSEHWISTSLARIKVIFQFQSAEVNPHEL